MDSHPFLINLSALMQRPTGISVYARNILPALKPLDPLVLTSSEIPGFRHCAIPDHLSPEFGSKGHLKRLLWLQRELPQHYTKFNSHLIFSPLPEAPIFRGCRYVVTVHDVIPLRFPRHFSPLTNFFRFYVPFVLSQAQHILCDSESTARDVHDYYGIPKHRLSPILLAYDVEHFRPSAEEGEGRYFVYLGRQDTYKNLHRLLAAFAQTVSRHEADLWLVGPSDPRYTPNLKRQAHELDISHRVHLLEYVQYQELPQILQGAIALLFPSLWEGFGLPVLEAMACGTPVVTSRVASLPEVTGDAALLIDPYRVDQLADAIQRLVQEPALRQQLRAAGLARAQLFSWQRTGQQTLEVLQNFL